MKDNKRITKENVKRVSDVKNKNNKRTKKIKKNIDLSKVPVLKFFNEFLREYNDKLKKQHIIIYVICLVLFFIFLAFKISNINVTQNFELVSGALNTSDKTVLLSLLKESVISIFLVIFAGITPFIHLPVLGFAYPYVLAANIAEKFMITGSRIDIVFMTIGSIIQVISISLAITLGFYYCSFTTKKFRYSQRSGFGIDDLKRQVYTIRKNEESLEKLEIERQKKREKIKS